MFEDVVNAFTVIGQIFVLLVLFCLACLCIFGIIMLFDLRNDHRKSKLGKHQSAGEITTSTPPVGLSFFDNPEENEARAREKAELEALRQQLKSPGGAETDWLPPTRNTGPDEPTIIYPFNMQGVEVKDATHPYFRNR